MVETNWKCIKVDIEEKVTQALDTTAEKLQPETWVDCSKCNDIAKLIVLIKDKLSVSSWNKKVKILSWHMKVGLGPFKRFLTCMSENAHANAVRCAMVCDVYFPFTKIL